MKIVVFGATGRTGIPLIEQALAKGHSVVAFVRDPQKLSLRHDRLSVVQGDVMNAADVQKAIPADVDAVISVLAPVKGSPATMMPTAADNIIAAMKQQGVKRLIWMTGAGVRMPQDQPQLFDKVMGFLLNTFAKEVAAQSREAVEKVQASGLDYVIPRAPMLTEAPHSGNYRVGWVGVNTGPRLARADAADFILTQLTDSRYVGQAPMVSN